MLTGFLAARQLSSAVCGAVSGIPRRDIIRLLGQWRFAMPQTASECKIP